MTPEQQERMRELPTLIETENSSEKAALLAAELSQLLELDLLERKDKNSVTRSHLGLTISINVVGDDRGNQAQDKAF